jgi:DNA-binding IclR family transcriptional regulator
MNQHRIPAVDRALAVLDALAASPNGATLQAIAASLRVPRTTTYRILNSLERHEMATRIGAGVYRLGPHLIRLARLVPNATDIVGAARPAMERLARELGEAVKLSIHQGDEAVVVAVVQSPGNYGIATSVGRRFPWYAGAAGKMLAAHLPPAAVQALLARSRTPITSLTITSAVALRRELSRARARGYADDRGEHTAGVHAIAAPIFDAAGEIAAAVSVPFMASRIGAHAARIRTQAVVTAAEITRAIGGLQPAPAQRRA